MTLFLDQLFGMVLAKLDRTQKTANWCEMTKSKVINSVATGAILLAVFMPVSLSGAEKTNFSANVGMVSEYFFRGFKLSN